MDRKLPSFLIIGAIKGATTWLSWQLRQSPGIFLPEIEPHYFSREYKMGLARYEDIFSAAGVDQIIGEKTADYLANPDAAGRAAVLLPSASLIAMLRNPVDRAYSDYCMLYRRRTVTADIDDYLDPRRAQFRRFLDNGLYHAHLSRWLASYERSSLLVMTMEDVVHSPQQSLSKAALHIDAQGLLLPRATPEPVNAAGAELLPLTLRRILAPLKGALAPLRGNRLFESLRGRVARPLVYPALSNDLRMRLVDFYADDVLELQALLGRNLAHWLEHESRAAA